MLFLRRRTASGHVFVDMDVGGVAFAPDTTRSGCFVVIIARRSASSRQGGVHHHVQAINLLNRHDDRRAFRSPTNLEPDERAAPSSAASDVNHPGCCFLLAARQPISRHYPALEARSVSMLNRPVSRPGAACVMRESATGERIPMRHGAVRPAV